MENQTEFVQERGCFELLLDSEKEQLLDDRKAQSLQKQPKKEPKKKRSCLQLPRNNDNEGINVQNTDDTFYKNSSLWSACTALNRHFKSKLGIDIISRESFIIHQKQWDIPSNYQKRQSGWTWKSSK